MNILSAMKHSPLHNYGGIPGLTSWLIGAPSEQGTVRLMECSRDHYEPIIPHNHRFDFECIVLCGNVRNIIWTADESGDEYQVSQLRYEGTPGNYQKDKIGVVRYKNKVELFRTGQKYGMSAEEIHSIFFGKDTKVLFFEGPDKGSSSFILEPFVNNEVVPTFKVEPWMFKKG